MSDDAFACVHFFTFHSDTRTSRNAWVGRTTSAPCESLYLRAADLLQLNETMLNSNTNSEDMQVGGGESEGGVGVGGGDIDMVMGS
jgi:hypothetical protein